MLIAALLALASAVSAWLMIGGARRASPYNLTAHAFRLRDEAIADPRCRQQMSRARGVGLELLSQMRHVDP